MGAALILAAIVAPWLVWLPAVSAPATTVLLATVAIIGALHGWGRLVARLAHRANESAALVVQWGTAAVLAVSGLMLALGIYEARFLVLAGTVMHSADVAVRFVAVRESLAPLVRWMRARYWLVPFTLLGFVALINILGAAGSVSARPFDDETHVVAQVERLSSTGALADPIGFPRMTQLGGHVTLGALLSPFGDARLVRVIDRGIGVVLFLLLACSRLRARDAESAIWCSLLVVLTAAFKTTTADLLPLWLPAGLVLALHVSLTTSTTKIRSLLPIGLLAGGLCALRLELAPVAIAFVIAAWWPTRDWRRAMLLLGALTVTVLGYLIARHLAWASVAPGAARALVGKVWPLPLRLGLFAGTVAAAYPLIALASRELDDRSLRWFALAASVGVAGVVSRLTGTPPLSAQLLWPLAIAGVTVLATALCGAPSLRNATMALGALACVLAFEAQDTGGRRAWSWRYSDLMFDVQHARDLAPEPAAYADLLSRVPAGDRIAVWVTHPEVLDYVRNPIVDLRTPASVRSVKIDRLLATTAARWLLVEAQSDPVAETLAEKGQSVMNAHGVRLVALGQVR